MPQLRSVRVTTDPPQVRVAGFFGRLVDVSATGALVQVQQTPAPDREWRMLINVEPEPVAMRVRVVRSTAVPVRLPGATWQRQEYVVGLAFTDLPRQAMEFLRKLCGEAFTKRE